MTADRTSVLGQPSKSPAPLPAGNGAGDFDGCPSTDVRSARSEEHTSELQSQSNLVCRLLLEKKKISTPYTPDPPEKCNCVIQTIFAFHSVFCMLTSMDVSTTCSSVCAINVLDTYVISNLQTV